MDSGNEITSEEKGGPRTPKPEQSSTQIGVPSSFDSWEDPFQNEKVKGLLIGDYTIESLLGQGGCARVFLSTHNRLRRKVALKLLHGGKTASGEQRRRFEREAEAIAKLNHPGIVQVYEVGECDSGNFIALEYLEGGSLDKLLLGRPLPPNVAAALIARLARILQTAHEAGILHRDLKPANILLSARPDAQEGRSLEVRESLADLARVSDFGLARYMDEEGQTQVGTVLGTPSYMAPEQASGVHGKFGPPTDVYSLGAILYETLTGRPPFRAATSLATILLVTRQDPIPPRQLNPGVPVDLETICLKCLRKDPAQRYPTAKALADDLEAWLADKPISARPAGFSEKLVKWVRRNPWPSVAMASLVLLLGTFVGFGLVLERIRENARWLSLREQLQVADGYALGLLLEQVPPDSGHDPELIRFIGEIKEDPELSPRQKTLRWLNLSLACQNPAPLLEWLESRLRVNQVGPEVLPLIGGKLRRSFPDPGSLSGDFSKMVFLNADPRYRLRVLGARVQAGYQNLDSSELNFVANALLEEEGGLRRNWSQVFAPISQEMIGVLNRMLTTSPESLTPPKRQALLEYSVWFGGKDPRQLLVLGLGAEGTVLRDLVDELQVEVDLQQNAWPALWRLAEMEDIEPARKYLNQALEGHENPDFWRRARANALLFLLINRDGEEHARLLGALESALRQNSDCETRHHLVVSAAQAQAPLGPFLELFRNSKDKSVRRAAIWALGGYSWDVISSAVPAEGWLRELAQVHGETEDPGLHAAIDWAVGVAWGQSAIPEVAKWLPQGNSLGGVQVNSAGIKMVRVRKGTVNRSGARKIGESGLHEFPVATEVIVGQDYFLGMKEVTAGAFQEYKGKLDGDLKDPDTPALNVSLLEAVRFCNWLSKKEGIPESAWYYPPEVGGNIDLAGLVDLLRANRQKIKLIKDGKYPNGYRLPTEDEWEYACRAGSVGLRPFGEASAILEKFAFRSMYNSRPARTGSLIPNDFGFFDMLGNALEWTDDPVEPFRLAKETPSDMDPNKALRGYQWVMRGAGFDFQPLFFRSDYRYKEIPTETWFSYGFRVARWGP